MKKFRSYPVRFCCKLVCSNIMALIGAFIILNIFSFIPDRLDVWWKSFTKTAVVIVLLLIFACILINIFMKKRTYHINYNEKFLREGNKIIYYEYVAKIKVKKTITHKIFGLVTIKVKTPYGKIVLRDVPEKIEDYIRGKC